MNVTQAIELAGSPFIPGLLMCDGPEAMDAERARNEEAIRVLRTAWFAEERPDFSFDLVRGLADRNRSLCDSIGPRRLRDVRGLNMARGLADADLVRGIAALQGRSAESVAREVRGDRGAIAAAYVSAPVKGVVVGVDLETTGRDPDRGYIIDTGWELMDLGRDGSPYAPFSSFSGLPSQYEETGVPLERVHHIIWRQVGGRRPFREDAELQSRLLEVLEAHPYMAHNAAFEDSWLMLNLDGYAEARKDGRIVPIDTRDICRRLDPAVASLPRESRPASLESWARRRGTLDGDGSERHLGLDDTDLMLRTVRAEFGLRNMFARSGSPGSKSPRRG